MRHYLPSGCVPAGRKLEDGRGGESVVHACSFVALLDDKHGDVKLRGFLSTSALFRRPFSSRSPLPFSLSFFRGA